MHFLLMILQSRFACKTFIAYRTTEHIAGHATTTLDLVQCLVIQCFQCFVSIFPAHNHSVKKFSHKTKDKTAHNIHNPRKSDSLSRGSLSSRPI